MMKSGSTNSLEEKIFSVEEMTFDGIALEIFRYQYEYNHLYQKYCNLLGKDAAHVNTISEIPFLPIQFFKNHDVVTGSFSPEIIFESSGTTGTINSRHLLRDKKLYEQSFSSGFRRQYGVAADWCILGLLPSYLEKGSSSLVYMVNDLIKQSEHPASGFYLHDHTELHEQIAKNEAEKQPTLLIGVTYALLDFATSYPGALKYTTVIETGGMKGRRKELTRQEVHQQLRDSWELSKIHSEYGMTELLSQAWSDADGIFTCPPWLQICVREEDDPFRIYRHQQISQPKTGVINIIDLANLHSCAFLATDDAGRLHPNGSFEVLGRVDNSDIRGCGLMIL